MSFGISIVKNPVFIFDERRECEVINWDESQENYNLDFNFDKRDFDELHNLLEIKLPLTERYDGESYVDHEERLKNEYLRAAKKKGYEMLGRIWYWYESVIYLPTEINQLLEECLKLKEEVQNSEQLIAMDKLIFSCNEALKTNSGIFLGSD